MHAGTNNGTSYPPLATNEGALHTTAAGSAVARDDAQAALAPALTQSLRATLQTSVELLAASAADVDLAVHAVRRNNKNTLATFWLLAPWVAPASFERAHGLVRESSKSLRRPRRAVALLRTLEELAKPDTPIAPPALEERLASERRVPVEVLQNAQSLLASALEEVRSWAMESVSDDDVLSRFQKSRRRTLQKTRAARRKASPRKLHSLRKAVKRHIALHHAVAPFVEHRSSTKHLDALADALGNVNDLEDLRQVLRAQAGAEDGEWRRLDRRARRRQKKQIESSLELARKVRKKTAKAG